jgi:diguanylate cyclase (GGDEF)-like protein
MAADLCLSLKRTPDAVRLLGELFDRQISVGDAVRAGLTYKKLGRFVNPTAAQKARYGKLLEGTNRKLAIEVYESAFEEMIKGSLKVEALDVLKTILTLDPGEKNTVRLAELCSEVGDHRAAANAYMKLAASDATGNAATWYEKAYGENSSDEEIALAYARSLLAQQQVGAAIFILEPLINAGNASAEFRDTFSKSLMAASRFSEAEPVLWQLFDEDSTRIQEIASLMESFLHAGEDAKAVVLARKLEQQQRRKGDRRAFISLMQGVAAKYPSTPELLEFMSEIFNASNREGDYSQTLLKLFDLNYGMGNFAKAAECLDKAAEIDAYEPGHQKRLESLRGKIDENRFQVISSRFTSMGPAAAKQTEERTLGASTLQDLMLQAEILVQYGMRTKALERLQRIQELFPHEEDRNQDLHALYMTAGLNPQYSSGGQPPPAAVERPTAAPAESAATRANETSDASSFVRVSEITRKLYREGNADGVLSVAASEILGQWKTTRCVVAMRKPGLMPSVIRQRTHEGSDAPNSALAKAICAIHDLAIANGTLMLNQAQAAPELLNVREALAELQIVSLLAIPLSDGPDNNGILLLTQSSARTWGTNDVMVLKTIGEQIVMALNNVGLRRLVKNLSVTDEHSGLLKRASYLDLLLAETKRAAQQNTPVTVVLLRAGDPNEITKEFGDTAVEAAMQQVSQVMSENIRQNDLAFRYDSTTVALVLGETAEAGAVLAVEKLRKLTTNIRLNETSPVKCQIGIAEAVVRHDFDAVDTVTEVVNRADQALAAAIAKGPDSTVVQAPALAAAAVA